MTKNYIQKITNMIQLFLLVIVMVAGVQGDAADNQIVEFKRRTKGPIATMTTAAGAPIEEEDTTTLNKNLFNNEFFMDTVTHIVRERIPERLVHAKASGAFGYFEVTDDITDICRAKLFSKVGKRTPVAVRLSTSATQRGSIDTSRDIRGFSIKFYTEDGNFDIAGFNTPMFMYKDPVQFSSLVRSFRRNPSTNLFDNNSLWDFLTQLPELLFIYLIIFGDRGIPDGYRHMPGFAIHTYQVVNKHGENHFIRFHFQPDAGIKNLRTDEARRIAGSDPDYATRDLYNAIAKGNFPSWTASIQVLTESDVKNATFDVFDVTKILPLDKYPLRPLGRLVLNRNPVNFFAEVEQLAFCPANLVDGILGGPDKVYESRRLAYRDAQYHRLGGNFLKIPVNCPMRHRAFPYNRDGMPPVNDNEKDTPNYYPNSFNGPVPYKSKYRGRMDLIKIQEEAANNYDQARDWYLNEIRPSERKRLVQNIVDSLKPAAKFLHDRAVDAYTRIHPDLGAQVRQGLLSNSTGNM